MDGCTSSCVDDIRHSGAPAERGISSLDCSTSGGSAGRGRGCCLMIGGPKPEVHGYQSDIPAVTTVWRRGSVEGKG